MEAALLVDVLLEAVEVAVELEQAVKLRHEVERNRPVERQSECGRATLAAGGEHGIRLRPVAGLPALLPLVLRVLHGDGGGARGRIEQWYEGWNRAVQLWMGGRARAVWYAQGGAA
jgi:hypothetical protein